MPLVASFQVADGLAGSCGGVLRGQGRQHLGAFFNMLAYYVLALPLGITLAFRANYGLQGLWIGACATGLCMHILMPTSLFFVYSFLSV
jgi:MATE family multidrug resistance protein